MLTRRLLAGSIASLGWTALLVQLALTVQSALMHEEPVIEAVSVYFSFFTVLTNLAVAICLSLAALKPAENLFWNRPAVQASLAVYILVVAIVYAAVLQGLSNPTGLEYLTDRVFHAAVPVAYLAFWLFFTPKGTLRFADQLTWQLYPTTYFCYILARGASYGVYPYPFLNVNQDGYEVVFLNSLMLLALFLVLGVLLILIDWFLGNLQARWQGQYPMR